MGFRLNHGSAAIPLLIFLIAIMFIALTATSLIANDTISTEEDLQKYVDDAVNDISSYLKIQHVFGSFSENSPYAISKIAIQSTPLFHQDINISNLIIQVQTATDLRLFTFSSNITSLTSGGVFSHQHWNNLSTNQFGILSIKDIDNSLLDHQSFSEPSDIAFFTLSVEELSIKKGDDVTIVLSPGVGIEKSIFFKTPLPIDKIVNLW